MADVKCAKCSKKVDLSGDDYVLCDGGCSQHFHKRCSGLTSKEQAKLSHNSDEIWFCKTCKNTRTKRRSVLLTRSSIVTRSESASSLETVEKRSDTANAHPQTKKTNTSTHSSAAPTTTVLTDISITDVYTKLLELTRKHDDLNSEIRDLKATIIEFQEQTNALSEENCDLRNSNEILQGHINHLEDSLENFKQKSMENDIEIWGVDETNSENLDNIVKDLFSALDVNITETHIKDIFRKTTHDDRTNKAGIIVKCHRKDIRDRILLNKKGKLINCIDGRFNIMDLNSSSRIEVPKGTRPIYINEHITAFKKLLFKKARDLKRSNKVKFAWVKNGGVYIRESDKSKIIPIKHLDQFNDYK